MWTWFRLGYHEFLLSAQGKLVKGFRSVLEGVLPQGFAGLVRKFLGNLGSIFGFVMDIRGNRFKG